MLISPGAALRPLQFAKTSHQYQGFALPSRPARLSNGYIIHHFDVNFLIASAIVVAINALLTDQYF